MKKMIKKSPLLTPYSLPPFSKIRMDSIPSDLEQVLNQNRHQLKKLLQEHKNFNWETLMTPLEDMDDRLHHLWAPTKHLHAVQNSEALKKIYPGCIQAVAQYSTELHHNIDLYHAIRNMPRDYLNATQQKIIKDILQGFKLSGISLKPKAKQRFAAIEEKLAQKCTQFSDHVLDATQAWTFLIKDKKRLAGIPAHFLNSMRQEAKQKKSRGYLVTLDLPMFHAIMTYADDSSLRKELYEAYVTRASDQGPHDKKYDNTPVMKEILDLHLELVKLVGFKNYASYSLVTKMAKKPAIALKFLQQLVKKVRPIAEKEMKELKQFAKKEYGIKKLNPWDTAYYSEKLQQKLFHISEEELRPYFPETKVLQGLFALTEKLLGMKILEKKGIDRWHPDVRYFEIFDARNQKRGAFFIDLYVRENKRSGAWLDDTEGRRKFSPKKIRAPYAYLTCNFSKPVHGKPSLLTHSEVETLFHEFGHGLQHLLTQVDYPEASGINGVEWDAVELCSQFMENFCWQPSVLPLISSHYKTGKPLPTRELQALIDSKNFHAGLQIMRQIEFAWFDLALHIQYKPTKGATQIQKILDKIRETTSLLPVPRFNRFQNTFSHIFAGGYSAGYYSYLWAEVLSSDAFAQFEETDLFNRSTGQKFLETILETGGSRDAMKSFIAFRGRRPTMDAFLRHRGLR